MTAEVPMNTDEPQLVGQGESPSAQPPPIPSTPSTPPAPPQGRIAASIQRMPPGWRWALGLGLAFLTGIGGAWLTGPPPPAMVPIAVIVTVLLGLAAGFVLSTWWAVLLQAIATATGTWAAIWVAVQQYTGDLSTWGGQLGLTFYVFIFAALGLVPLIVVLSIGTAIGQWRGIVTVDLGRAGERVIGGVPGSQWVPSLCLVLGGAFFAGLAFFFSQGMGTGPRPTIASLVMVVFALTYLAAGWLLRAWWGLVAAPLVYVAIAAAIAVLIVGGLFGGEGIGNLNVVGFALWVMLPAVVMAATGTAIGMYRARRAGQPPAHGQPAT